MDQEKGESLSLKAPEHPASESFSSELFYKLPLNAQRDCLVYVARSVGFETDSYDKWFDGRLPAVEGAIKKSAWEGKGFLLSGIRGIGKTCLLSAAFKWLLSVKWSLSEASTGHLLAMARHRTIVTNHSLLAKAVKEEKFSDEMDQLASYSLEDMKVVKLLIVDDLGTGDNWAHLASGLEELIKHRAGARLPTWIASNYYAADIKKMPGWERIASVFGDSSLYAYIEANGESRRT